MRFLFLSSNTVLSNGYSLVEYPKGFNGIDNGVPEQIGKPKPGSDPKSKTKQQKNKPWSIDFDRVERTWGGDDHRWAHRFPLRGQLGRDKKHTFLLLGTEVLEGVGIRQIYVDKAIITGGVDDVAVLVWLF